MRQLINYGKRYPETRINTDATLLLNEENYTERNQ